MAITRKEMVTDSVGDMSKTTRAIVKEVSTTAVIKRL